MKENKTKDIDRYIIEAYKVQEVSIPSVDKAWDSFSGSLPAGKSLMRARHLNHNLAYFLWSSLLLVLFTFIAHILDLGHKEPDKTANNSANAVGTHNHTIHSSNTTIPVEKTKDEDETCNNSIARNKMNIQSKWIIAPNKKGHTLKAMQARDAQPFGPKSEDGGMNKLVCEMLMMPIKQQRTILNIGNTNCLKTETKENLIRKHGYSSQLDLYTRYSLLQNSNMGNSNKGFPSDLQLGLRYTRTFSKLMSADVGLALGQYRVNLLQFDGVSRYVYDSSRIAQGVDSFSGYLKKITYLEMPIRMGLNLHPHWQLLLGLDMRLRLQNSYSIMHRKYQDNGGTWQYLGTEQTTVQTNLFNKAIIPDLGWNLGLQYQYRRHILNLGYRSDLYFNRNAPAQGDVFFLRLYKTKPLGELYFSYSLRLF